MMLATASYAATAAGVRAVIAAYAQAIDDGRHHDIAAMFCADGLVDLPATDVVTGREALLALFGGGGKSPGLSRHLVTGTHVTRWSAHHAVAISDLVIAGRAGGASWGFQTVGRYFDLLHCQEGRWLFHARTLRFTDDA
jgi:SnoaL-like protein